MKTELRNGAAPWLPPKRNCLGRLSGLELCLVILVLLLLFALSGIINPCDDFYEFACGNYGLNRNLPANKPLRHTISDVQSRLNKQVKSILQMPIIETDSTWDKLAKGYYQKCLDEEELERSGFRAIKEIVDWIGGWPTLQGGSWKEWNHTWEEQLAIVMNKTGVNAVILELAVTHDPSNSSKSVIELDQPKWGVGSRWPYLMGPDDPMIKNYTNLMTLTAIALGTLIEEKLSSAGADPELAKQEMFEAMELELKLVNFSAEDMVRRDPERGNNRYQLWQLKTHFPMIDFNKYIKKVFHDLVDVSPNHTVIMREIEYFTGIQLTCNSEQKYLRIIFNFNKKDLYYFNFVMTGFSPFLPPSAREPFYQFKANQTGMFNSPPPDRWEDCVTLSVIMVDMPVGKLFVEHFFEKERAMAKMTELTTYLKGEFIKQLHILDWMDDGTRRRAVEKAGMIEYKNGFPDVLFNDTWMDKQWGMSIKPKEYLLHLTIRIKLARYIEELLRLDQPLDRTMWYQSPAQVDAYYAPNNNEMIFPAGIMQFPFLTLGVPNYITYGMVGAVIGHEVSHAFDDQGSQYDELGNLNDWWDAETAEKFAEKTRCFARQYGSIKVVEAGIHLNGQLSLGENIADNGGVKTAFNQIPVNITAIKAYKAWRSNTSMNEPALPGFQNFTSEQMFFLAYANAAQ
uniref:Peptidase_M13 domain-containing protein n=1 Tax=Heterorhabditis bacteriophora TaxID=37862 RepID=A0A1I7XPG6_HETBA